MTAPRIQPLAGPAPSRTSPSRVAQAGLVALCFVIYHDTLSFEFLTLGDYPAILARDAVRIGLNRETLGAALFQPAPGGWQPLTTISHALTITLFGPNPAAHHAVNVVLHALASVLAFRVFARHSGLQAVSFAAAALFAAHPLQTENVAWISGRTATLSAPFALLALDRFLSGVHGLRAFWSGFVLILLGMLFNPWVGTIVPLLHASARHRGLTVPKIFALYGAAILFVAAATAVTFAFAVRADVPLLRFVVDWLKNAIVPAGLPIAPLTAGAWGPVIAGAFTAIGVTAMALAVRALNTSSLRTRHALTAAGLVAACVFAFASERVAAAWKTDVVLFKRVLAKHGASLPAYIGLSDGYARWEMFPEAVDALEAAVEIAPADPRVWRLLGAAYANLGAGYPARDAYRQAYDLDPSNEEVAFMLSRLDEDIAKLEPRLAELEILLTSDPASTRVILELGRRYAFMGVPDKALALYDGVFDRDGELREIAAIAYAEAFARAGRTKESAAMYRRAFDANPGDPAKHFAIARQLYRSGDESGARAELNALLEEIPDDERALRVKRALGW